MTILITGIHGFVGSNLVSALKESHSIYGLDIIAPEKEGIIQTFSWNELDNLPEIDTIIHLAGKAHDTKKQAEAKTYFDINFGLTQQIFDYFLQSKAKQFIFFSSVKAVADSVPNGDVLTEDVVPHPVGAYGESKIAAEKYIQSQDWTDKKVYILRPCMIHGPGNKGNLNLLYQVVIKGIPWPLGAFENRRSFTSIGNISFVVGRIIEKNVDSGIYNMADDETLSTNELIELIASVSDRKSKIWKLSPQIMNLAAKLGTIFHLPLNSERLRKLTENYVVSNHKIKAALEIEKMPVSARNGFELTVKSFENQ
ncbi:MAG: NAD-dependent epimerase/dehydratase family protein [Dysgonamonadaceae bacterium]|nr:NAD-dependent epimerase/dehydratase family protein [Dysgonamonadaceae bacterium]